MDHFKSLFGKGEGAHKYVIAMVADSLWVYSANAILGQKFEYYAPEFCTAIKILPGKSSKMC